MKIREGDHTVGDVCKSGGDGETYESRGVVVTGSLGITVGLKYRVSLYNLVLQ